MNKETVGRLEIRNPTADDFPGMIALCERVYADAVPWSVAQLESHLRLFPEGQFIAAEKGSGRVAGMASSLIVRWDDYAFDADWRRWTDRGLFTNHDPENGRTLYGAEVMVDPVVQRRGIGKRLYRARRKLAQRFGLKRIRAGARLRGYHRYAGRMSPRDYVRAVVRGEAKDPTLSFQIREGFQVLAVVHSYLRDDPASLGYAAIIEWINPDLIRLEDTEDRDHDFDRPDRS